jgi:hypothetical protein
MAEQTYMTHNQEPFVSESHQAHYVIATAYRESLKLLMNVQSHPVQANSYLSITDERLVFRKKRYIRRRVVTISIPEALPINPRIPHKIWRHRT